VTGADVVRIVDCLERAGVRFWLDGGRGVDALLGEETRPHSDLDAVVELERAEDVIASLGPLGFTLSLDERPTRFVLADTDGRRIDFHPIVFDDEGNGRQIGAGPGGGDAIYPADGLLGRGAIEGRAVACLTPELLLRHHTGYEPQDKDRHNVERLCERFGLPLPRAYREAGRDDATD
jgi:lincosamide nucleotidyltransferase A/C/D/E